VLFIDLSGYSKITSVLADRGAYLLSKIVNSYLAELLRVVNLFGGDVVNFAGDAVMVVWESDSIEQQKMNVVCAAQCAMQLQELTGDYPIEGTDLYFRIHCGITCGELDTEVFTAPRSAHMQGFYHVVSGEPLVEIGDLVDSAKAGRSTFRGIVLTI
jgi:class 3 adenylate cyclase